MWRLGASRCNPRRAGASCSIDDVEEAPGGGSVWNSGPDVIEVIVRQVCETVDAGVSAPRSGSALQKYSENIREKYGWERLICMSLGVKTGLTLTWLLT